MVKEFTDFPDVGAIQVGDKIVGTRDNVNIQVDFDSGIKDSSGHYLFGYESSSVLAENYLKFKNAISGSPAVITTDGMDTNVSMLFNPKGEGDFTIDLSGLGNINLNTQSGKVFLNGTDPLYGFTTDETFTNASNEYASSSLAVKTYIASQLTPILGKTFITGTNETATLPHSHQLLGTAAQITVTNGVLSFPDLVTFPGSIEVTDDFNTFSGNILSTGTDINIVPDSGFNTYIQSDILGIGQALTLDTDATNKFQFGTNEQKHYIGNVEQLRINSTGLRVKSNLFISDSEISTSSGDLIITPFANLSLYGNGDITVLSGVSGGAGDLSLIVNGTGAFGVETGNGNIAFNTDSGFYDFSVNSSSVMDLTVSGFRLGATGARITSISTDGTLSANSDTLAVTEKAIKTYADASSTAIKSYSYITKTDNTANLPGSTPLSGLASGFLSNTTSTGALNPRTMTGTANQIDITNGNGVSGNPTFALSATIVTPGTLNVGTTFTIGSTVSVDSISNSASASSSTSLMTADAIQMAISSAVTSAKSFRGGYNASTNLFPTTGGTGIAGAVAAGDVWEITVPGTLGGTAVLVGNTILALTNVPGQTSANWAVNVNGVATVFGRAGIVTAQSGDYSFSLISGTAAVAQGGTGATSVGASGTLAQSNGTTYAFTTATYPASTTANQLLYSSSANVVSGLATTASATLTTDGSSVPAMTALTSGQILIGSTGARPVAAAIGSGTNILVTNSAGSISVGITGIIGTANGGTGNSSGQAGSVANALTLNNSGSGAASGTTFDGSAARTISYNTLGASPVAGSSSIVTVGTIASGTWQGTAVGSAYGGTGFTTYTTGDLIHASAANTLSKLGIGTTGQMLSVVSGDTAWSTPTYANSYSASSILYSNGASTVQGLATANSATLVTNSSGVPAMTASMTNGQVLIGSTGGTAAPATITYGNNLSGTVGANTLQINTANSYGRIGWAISQSAPLATAVITTGTLTEISSWGGQSFTLQSPNNNFSMTTDGRLKYTGTPTITLSVSYFCAFYNGAGFNYQVSLYKNTNSGTLVDVQSTVNNVANAEMIAASSGNFVSMSTNDYLSLYITTTGTSKTVGICTVSISALSVA